MLKTWSKPRIRRRDEMLARLSYLRFYEIHYKETSDYALDLFFSMVEADEEKEILS